MPPRKQPPPSPAAEATASDKGESSQVAEPLGVEPQTSQPPPKPLRYSVGVRNRCPWATIQSAGASWGREPTILAAEDIRLPELRRCEFLTVSEI